MTWCIKLLLLTREGSTRYNSLIWHCKPFSSHRAQGKQVLMEKARELLKLTPDESRFVEQLNVPTHSANENSFYEEFGIIGLRVDRVEPGLMTFTFKVPARLIVRILHLTRYSWHGHLVNLFNVWNFVPFELDLRAATGIFLCLVAEKIDVGMKRKKRNWFSILFVMQGTVAYSMRLIFCFLVVIKIFYFLFLRNFPG